ncbi:pyridoxal phosphate-dependent transferase [Aspergillus falconensis]
MADQPLFPLEAFYPTPGIIHVCAAGEGLPLRAHNAAFAQYMQDKAAGHTGPRYKNEQLDHVRALIAREWNATSEKGIGFAPSVADGVSLIVESLHWEEGDNVVVDADDFPSLIAPFAMKGQTDRERSGGNGTCICVPEVRYTSVDSLESTVNAKTRLIAVSYVSYLNGARANLAHYRRLADKAGAILIVDYSQAAGYAPIDASIADFAFGCSHKWLLGSTGVAIVYWNQARQPDWKPATAGWHSLSPLPNSRAQWEAGPLQFRDDALVFTRGNPSHLAIYILRESLDFLAQWPAVQVEKHVQILTSSLFDALERESIPSSTPREKEKHGASVTVHCKGAAEIVDQMREAGVYAWNGNCRVRFSFHGYNCQQDVERIMDIFPGLWRKYNI